ncbi:hypothetical protein [uncultured Friedmanniella sp.]
MRVRCPRGRLRFLVVVLWLLLAVARGHAASGAARANHDGAAFGGIPNLT